MPSIELPAELQHLAGRPIYFTADTHWGHGNILHLAQRPFDHIEEHDAALIDEINQWVGKDGVLIHCGDVAWGGFRGMAKYRPLIQTEHLVLVPGNHDRGKRGGFGNIRRLSEIFPYVYPSLTLRVDGITYTCTHVPDHARLPNIHGHSHNHMPVPYPGRLDVGVDAWDMRPCSLEEAVRTIQESLQDAALAA